MDDIIHEVKCEKADTASIVECLRAVPRVNFSNITMKLFHSGFTDLYIGVAPKIDNDLIKKPLDFNTDLGSSLEFFRSLDYMTGYTNGEGVSIVTMEEVMDLQQGFNISEGISSDALCSRFVPRIAKRSFDSIPEVSEALCIAYRADDRFQQAKNAVELCGHFMFAHGAVQSLLAHSKQNQATNTYQYILTRPVTYILGTQLPKWFEGAPHGLDLSYLFDFKDKDMEFLINLTFTDADKNMKQTMMKYWTNFAKTEC
ncbi:hypothetical protein KUTeg_019393 [Tegillarca granosa]|uniref:Carboxylesterase type B domain-containing protein n=1 Tax=Tegillarca granosa TaxID=220873 RepID=A0ABQ9EHD7_TEGGR|nr:hypothetical protein KUTeg_019393 [Tegillarca granosa]